MLVANGVISEAPYCVVDLDLMVDVELVIQLVPPFITWTTQITWRVQVHGEVDYQLVLFVLAQRLLTHAFYPFTSVMASIVLSPGVEIYDQTTASAGWFGAGARAWRGGVPGVPVP